VRPTASAMGVFRVLLLLLLIASVGCFGAYAISGQLRYRHYGLRLLQWTVGAGLVFFAVLIALRLSESGTL
jgi:hypothetical protein